MGHPRVISDNFDFSLASYFGFINCFVLPAVDLYLPLMPFHVNDKLMFPLCRTCAFEHCSTCNHPGYQRYLCNTWTSIELVEAVKRGYKLIEILEVYNYGVGNTSETLFKEYIKMWQRINQQATGWPDWCLTDDDKDKYICDYYAKEGVLLVKEEIIFNPCLRWMAKLFMNSYWGKLAQRANLPQTSLVKTYDEYVKIANGEKLKIKGKLWFMKIC